MESWTHIQIHFLNIFLDFDNTEENHDHQIKNIANNTITNNTLAFRSLLEFAGLYLFSLYPVWWFLELQAFLSGINQLAGGSQKNLKEAECRVFQLLRDV